MTLWAGAGGSMEPQQRQDMLYGGGGAQRGQGQGTRGMGGGSMQGGGYDPSL